MWCWLAKFIPVRSLPVLLVYLIYVTLADVDVNSKLVYVVANVEFVVEESIDDSFATADSPPENIFTACRHIVTA